MYGFIGLGAAGGNLVDEMAKKGYPSIAINFSSSDLDSLESVTDKLKLVGSEGVGKQRERAMALMQDNWESTIEFVKQKLSKPSVDVIFVCFSTAGGTGSGLAPICIELLKGSITNKTIVAVPILPDTKEFTANQMNTQEALLQLSELDTCVLPLDNQSFIANHDSNIPKNELFQKINSEFSNLLTKIDQCTYKKSKFGILDKRDAHQLFSTKGIMVISQTSLIDLNNLVLSVDNFTINIQKSWKKTIFSPIQFEKIIRAGIIFEGDESMLQFLRYEKLFDAFKNQPLELFEGYYTEGKGNVICILSGLNWIYNRVEEIDVIIEKHKSIEHEVKPRYTSKHIGKTEMINTISKNVKQEKKFNAMDVLAKYNTR
ncbi:cell division protein FtsZ [Cytobacillus kochii]|uniref:cell division protein FtsZ n=1 Tax=Cytobacillus kochii TaxID=859143 RepID=UPI001CD25D74|nr:cell division protein FtsZ [Cytobacillus kochii]MCA1025694.1 cell division protein FtsZ [Cytobacillus kochii]